MPLSVISGALAPCSSSMSCANLSAQVLLRGERACSRACEREGGGEGDPGASVGLGFSARHSVMIDQPWDHARPHAKHIHTGLALRIRLYARHSHEQENTVERGHVAKTHMGTSPR
jgi:hypothetical protein